MRRLLLATVLFVLILVAPTVVQADVNDFTITSFSSDQTLTRGDGSGTLRVIERIKVRFTDHNHGILRAIPQTYQGNTVGLRVNKVSSDSGAPAEFNTYASNGNTVVQIGNPDKTVTGAQEYTIDYTLRNVVASFGDSDQLYWDVNGDQWDQPMEQVSATIHLPSDVPLATQNPVCYNGAKGTCSITRAGNDISVSATNVKPRQTLTYVVGFQKGYFTPGVSQVASSDVNNFRITNFATDETLSREDKQGRLHIVERISIRYSANNHGFFRAIPASYHGAPLKLHINSVSSSSGAPAEYTTYGSEGNTVIKIGSPDQTVTGAQEYTIDYTLSNVIAFFADGDELYWDVNGDQWEQSFDNVTATIHLPPDAKLSTNEPVCYAGITAKDSSRCLISRNGSEVLVSAVNLGRHETLTYVVGFQKGYFTAPTIVDYVRDYLWQLLALIVLPILSFIIGFSWWWKRGRDAPGHGTIVPQYAPPENILPIEAGAIADFQVDNRDITAMFIDLARRKYIKIIEKRENRLIGKDKLSYSLELLRQDETGLSVYERTLLNGVFSSGKLVANDDGSATVKLSSLKTEFYKTAESLRKAVSKDLTKAGYFRQDPRKYLFKFGSLVTVIYIAIFLFGTSAQYHLLSLLGGLVASAIILILFARHIPARTAQGVAAREQLLGLKLYMETAEKDRMKLLEGPNAAYAANAGEPVRTVELFEKLLPFAIVMGVEKEWAGQFKDIYAAPPDWYSGNITSFNTGYLVGSFSGGFSSAVNASFAAPSSSGSSGFGGGGFSGGGGGGGGGGGW